MLEGFVERCQTCGISDFEASVFPLDPVERALNNLERYPELYPGEMVTTQLTRPAAVTPKQSAALLFSHYKAAYDSVVDAAKKLNKSKTAWAELGKQKVVDETKARKVLEAIKNDETTLARSQLQLRTASKAYLAALKRVANIYRKNAKECQKTCPAPGTSSSPGTTPNSALEGR
jgi:hypothetical protein